ncbi:MAG: MFS transporter [Phycisphaeraceae bacterium]
MRSTIRHATLFTGQARVPASLREQLAMATLAWVFGSYWLWTISGAAMTRFGQELGMPDYAFGLLAALPFVGTLLQVPASWALERYGRRKPVFIISGVIGRLMWTVAALIPWWLPGAEAWWWPTMLVTLLISWAAAHAGTPAWMNWMSDLIPRKIRGRYFAVRNLIGQPIGLLVTLAVGFLLDQASAAQAFDGGEGLMLKVTAGVLAVGGLMGMLDILCFRWVGDAQAHEHVPDTQGVLRMLWSPMREKNFRRYLAFNFVFMLAIGFVGQYTWLYVFDVVGWSNWQANFLLLGVPLIVRMGCYPLWGRLVDRLGKKPVLLVTGVVTTFGAVGWLLITPEQFWPGYGLILLTAFAWPGMEIANFNFILDMAGTRRDEKTHEDRRVAGSACVALNSVAIAIGGVVSGLFAAAVAKGFGDVRETFVIGGLTVIFTYHGLLFLISTVLRGLSLVWAVGLEEPAATGTRDAIRYMTASLYSNVRQAAFLPARVVGHAARWSYRVNGHGPKR